MGTVLRGKTREIELNDIDDYMELFYANGWTDGLPVVMPTEKRVLHFLEANMLAPDAVIGSFPVRNRRVTAEQVAINAVMAGCRPEYLPVIMASVEAMADPAFGFNHIAGLCSTYPHFVISGPVVENMGFNTGIWAMGGGDRAGMTIGRALSLILWNCLELNPRAIQRGTFGNPSRFASVVAEAPNSPWQKVNEEQGFDSSTSTVTVVSCYLRTEWKHFEMADPKYMAQQMCHTCFDQFFKTDYLILVSPESVGFFAKNGWGKQDLRQYLLDNTKLSIAQLKRSARWGVKAENLHNLTVKDMEVLPGDEETYIPLFKEVPDEPWGKYLFREKEKRADVILMCTGGDAGREYQWSTGHRSNTRAVTRPIKILD